MSGLFIAAAALVGLGFAPAAAAQDGEPKPPSPLGIDIVTVVGNAPLPGTRIDIDKLPGEVQTLSVSDLARDRPMDVLANLVGAQLADVSLNDEQGSQFQPDFVYRGFEASPISGVAEGIAVYQDGVRLNEAFGDNVNWDLVPEFAVQSLTVQSNNPVFGLNALGGAVTLAMKDGLSFRGSGAELSGGSFGDVTGDAEVGGRAGDLGFYLGVGGVHDDGFRYHSPTSLRQAYGDLAYDGGRLTLHLSVTGALNDIDAVGPTPVQMLAQDPRSVFTYPQSMRNAMGMVQLRGVYRAGAALTISASLYYRHFEQTLVDGNTTDVTACANVPSQLCLEGAGNYPGDALYDSNGAVVAASVLPAGATPGETDDTHTSADSAGAAIQASLSSALAGHANSLVVGASLDHGGTDYSAYGELGVLQPSLKVVGVGVTIDQALSPTAQPPIEAPVSVEAQNTYGGLYAIDVLDLTTRLSWTLSGRVNIADLRLDDRLGDTLNAGHDYSRANPGTGLTYKLAKGLTVYAGYSESNRAPTAGELSCADPSSPCLLDAFLVSDPALKQVVSHNVEAGLRGRFAAPGLAGAFTWNLSAYRTEADDDILLLATAINGFGYFHNAGATQRQGIDLHLGYRGRRLSLNASYAYLEATFRDAEILASNSPAANAEGLIQIRPGDRLPMNPANRVTLAIDYSLTTRLSIGGDLRAQSGQYLVGDESNQEPRLPGFATLNLRSSLQLGPHLELFGQIQNALDRRYYTYGAFTQLGGLPPNFSLTNPRTYSPAQGRSVSVGARLRFD